MTTLDLDVDVAPRIDARRLGVVVHGGADATTDAALAAQDEPIVQEDAVAVAHLVTGAEPAPDWSRHLLDAHEEGWGAVGRRSCRSAAGRATTRRPAPRALGPGGGATRGSTHPLLLPSLLAGIDPAEHDGLPGRHRRAATALFEGRALVRLRRDPVVHRG